MKPTQEQVIAWAHDAGMTPISHVSTADVICNAMSIVTFAALAYEAGRESTKLDGIHTCHADCQKPACVAVREAKLREKNA